MQLNLLWGNKAFSITRNTFKRIGQNVDSLGLDECLNLEYSYSVYEHIKDCRNRNLHLFREYQYEYSYYQSFSESIETLKNEVNFVFNNLQYYNQIPSEYERTEIIKFLDNYREKFDEHIESFKKQIPVKLQKKGCVYIIKDTVNMCFKIGASANVKARFNTLQISTPNKLVLYFKSKPIENFFRLEEKLHNKYKDKRLASEWFSLNNIDIKDIKNLVS